MIQATASLNVEVFGSGELVVMNRYPDRIAVVGQTLTGTAWALGACW